MIKELFFLFFFAFSLNLAYELLHSLLYKTCREASLPHYVYLMFKASLFDGVAICTIYFISILVVGNNVLWFTLWELVLFSVLSLAFAYTWEVYAIQHKRWEYTKAMPIVLGVGVTPLVQLALTGLLSLYILFSFI